VVGICFGLGSSHFNTASTDYANWTPQIGIGLSFYHGSSGHGHPDYDYSAGWADPIYTTNCGTYGNGIGINGHEGSGGGAIVNL
jgi:hypothetical protein